MVAEGGPSVAGVVCEEGARLLGQVETCDTPEPPPCRFELRPVQAVLCGRRCDRLRHQQLCDLRVPRGASAHRLTKGVAPALSTATAATSARAPCQEEPHLIDVAVACTDGESRGAMQRLNRIDLARGQREQELDHLAARVEAPAQRSRVPTPHRVPCVTYRARSRTTHYCSAGGGRGGMEGRRARAGLLLLRGRRARFVGSDCARRVFYPLLSGQRPLRAA